MTHQFELHGFDHLLMQRQVGHVHASTTSLYTAVSSDHQTKELDRVLESTIAKASKDQKKS